MKKLLLSLVALLTTVGAWAQIDDLNDLNNESSYTVKSMERGFLYYDSNNGDYVTSSSHTDLVDATPTGAENELFAFLRTNKTAVGNYYLFSKSANKFVTYKGTGVALELTDNPEHAWTVEANGVYFTIKVPETEKTYINITNWQAQFGCKVTSTNPDEGNKMTIKEVGTAEDFAAALAKITNLETTFTLSYTITDAAGNVFEGTYEAPAETEPTFTGVAGYTLSDKNWNGNELTATINFPFPVSKKGGKTNATMISSFGANRNKLFADATSVKAILDEEITVSNLSTHLWAIFPEFNEGAFVFTVMNTATGKYIYSESNANNHAEGAVVLSEEASKMTVEGSNRFKLPTGKYLSLNSSTQTQVQYLGTWGAHNGCNLAFPSYAVVSLNAAGYASTYLPFAAALSEGLEAYAVTAKSATMATLTALDGIKANQGAILKGDASAEYVLAAGNVTSNWSGNLLLGSTTDTYVEGPAYVLAGGVSDTGLYKAVLNKDANGDEGTTHFKNNAGKAYLPAEPASARFLSFDFGTETAIESIEGENGNVKAEIYDLAGRRVQNAQKGLYIVNGKKVIK